MLNEPGRNHLSYLVRFDVQLDASVQPSTRGGGNDTDAKDSFTIEVHPEWAPRGAARFAELVSLNFFDEARFFRVFRPAYPKPLLLLPANQPASAFKTSQLRQRVWAHDSQRVPLWLVADTPTLTAMQALCQASWYNSGYRLIQAWQQSGKARQSRTTHQAKRATQGAWSASLHLYVHEYNACCLCLGIR